MWSPARGRSPTRPSTTNLYALIAAAPPGSAAAGVKKIGGPRRLEHVYADLVEAVALDAERADPGPAAEAPVG